MRNFSLLTAGFRTFAFPPLRDFVLLTLASVIAQARHLHLSLVLPAWFRKASVAMLLRVATSHKLLRFRAHHGSLASRPLPQQWEWLLLTFKKGPPPRPLAAGLSIPRH
jgi:hypothetical protein